MRKSVRQMTQNHYSGLKFKSLKELFEAHKLWKWEDDGYIAYSTASLNNLGELAKMNGLEDGEYALTEAK